MIRRTTNRKPARFVPGARQRFVPGARQRFVPGARQRRLGFTLIELMMALTLGAIAVASVYAVGKGSTHFFHQQYRVSNTVSRLRVAMARVKRDFQRAGYLATPNVNDPNESTCGLPGVPLQTGAWQLAGIMTWINGWGDNAGNGMDPGGNYGNQLPADEVWLLGNFMTGYEYAATLQNSNASNVQVDSEWYAFRRDFTNWGTGNYSDARFTSVFLLDRPVRVMTNTGRKHFARVDGTVGAVGLADPVVRIDPPVPTACANDVARIAPLQVIRYRVVRGANQGAGDEWDPQETRPQLKREEVDLDNPAATLPGGEDSALLDFVVAFDVNVVATNAVGAIPDNIVWGPANNTMNNNAQDLRMVQITLAARSPGLDPTFPLNGVVDPFARFTIDPIGDPSQRLGAARVRRLRADVFLGNMAVSP